jgi:uncharacterized membrane protein
MKLIRSAFITLCVMTLGLVSPVRAAGSEPQDLGTLGGAISAANAISKCSKVITDIATLGGNTATHAVIWEGGKIIDLGVFSGGSNSAATGAASHQRAAGTSDFDDPVNGVVPHGFLFSGGTLENLGSSAEASHRRLAWTSLMLLWVTLSSPTMPQRTPSSRILSNPIK